MEYFESKYLENWKCNWSFARSTPGLSRSNGNSEGFNQRYKGKFTENKRLQLGVFMPEFFAAVEYISERYNPIVYAFPTEPVLSNNKMLEAHL